MPVYNIKPKFPMKQQIKRFVQSFPTIFVQKRNNFNQPLPNKIYKRNIESFPSYYFKKLESQKYNPNPTNINYTIYPEKQ